MSHFIVLIFQLLLLTAVFMQTHPLIWAFATIKRMKWNVNRICISEIWWQNRPFCFDCSLYARHFFSQLHELITRTTHTHWPFVSCLCFTLSSNQHRTFDAALLLTECGLCVQLKNEWWSHHQTTPFPPYFEVEQCRLTSIYFLCISQNLWFLTDQSQISTGLMFILCGPRALLLFSRFVSHLENKKKKTLNAKVSKGWSETAAETSFQAKYV